MLAIDEDRPSLVGTMRQGFAVGVLNPKALVFFSAVFPQFVDTGAGPILVQLLIFGLIFAVLAGLLDGTWGLLVGSSRDWFATSSGRLVALRTIGGTVMVLLGVLVFAALLSAHLTE